MSNTPTHGSDVQETPDWWKASDGRFYPPELHPNYVKPEAPAAAPAAPASSPPSLSERMRAGAEQAGGGAAAAADAGAGSIAGAARDTLGGAASTAETAASGASGAAAGAAGAAAAGAAGVAGAAAAAATDASLPDASLPDTSPVVDPRATIPVQPTSPQNFAETVIQQVPPAAAPATPPAAAPPSVPPAAAPPSMPAPGAPPSMPPAAAPPSMPAPGAPPSMPPAAAPTMPPVGAPPSPGTPPMPAPGAPPGMPPAPQADAPMTMEGPGGITYTAAPDTSPASLGGIGGPAAPGQQAMPAPGAPMAAPMSAPAKIASATAGAVALLAGIAAIAGSLLKWGKGSVLGADGAEKAIIEVAGFDSNGLITAICGGVLILCGLLFFMGVPKQLYWAVLAFIGGAVIVGTVVFSMIDIGDLSNRYAVQWQNEGLASVGDVISTQADLGLWIAGAGGVLGVLAAPFVNRS